MIKKIFHGLFTFLFIINLLLFLLLGSISLVFSDPLTVKSAVKDSGLYDNATNTALVTLEQELAKSPNEQGGDQIDLNQPGIQQAAKKALPPETLQYSIESIIDGTSNWLNGGSEKPEFTIDLSNSKKVFAQEVGEYAMQRYADLPECDQSQIELVQANPDPLSIPCQAPGLDAEQARKDVVQKINSDELFKNPVITEQIFENEQGESPFKNTSQIQAAYVVFKLVPWVLLIVTLMLGAFTVFLSANVRRGIKQVATTLTSIGGVLSVGAIILIWAATQLRPEAGQSLQQEALGTIISGLVSALLNVTGQQILVLSAMTALAGLIALTILKFSKPNQNTPDGTAAIQH